MGRLGDVLQIMRDGKEMAEKNGNDPWLFNFREAWLRMLALDFEGSTRVCDAIFQMKTPYSGRAATDDRQDRAGIRSNCGRIHRA